MRRLALLLLMAFAPALARAQASSGIAVRPGPLLAALDAIRRGADIDLVYATRYVEGVQTRCRYRGADAARALACALEGTPLVAVRVRPRQFVLRPRAPEPVVPVAPAPLPPPPPPPPPPPRVTLAGFVADVQTGEVLPGAIVYLPERRAGTVTNAGGYFALPNLPVGTFRVQASYVGYETLDTTLAGDARLQLRLRPQRIVTPEIVVERPGGAEASSVTGALGLSAAQLESFPAQFGEQDVLRQVEWLPGVARSGAATGGLLVRGGEPDENLYLLDGAPVYDPWHAFSLVSAFQAETVQHVQLYRGVMPAEYGGRLSSVMAFELRESDHAAPSATVGFSPFAARFVMTSPLSRDVSFMVAARRSYLDKLIGTRHPVEAEGVRDTLRTGYYFNDLIARATYRPGRRHRLSATYYRGGDRLDLKLPLDVSLTPGELTRLLRPADLFFDLDFRWGNDLASARYEYLVSPQLYATATAYQSRYGAAERTQVRPTSRTLFTSQYVLGIAEQGGGVGVEWFAPLGTNVRAGVQAARRSFDSFLSAQIDGTGAAQAPLADRGNTVGLEGAAYVQANARVQPGVRVQGGLRVSGHTGVERALLLPNASVQLEVVPERLVMHAGVGRQVQYLHRLRDRYSLLYDLVASRWIPASDSVRPATGWMAAFGARATPSPHLTLTADAYVRNAQNVLLPRDVYQPKDGVVGTGTGLAALLGQYAPASARAAGVEATVQTERGPWSVYASYTGELSARRPKGATDFQGARFNVPHRLEVVTRRTAGRVAVTLSGEARSGMPDAVPTAIFRLGDGLGEEELYLARPNGYNGRLPATARLDASAEVRWQMLEGEWRGALQLYNLVNVQNVLSRTYVPTPEGIDVRQSRGLRVPLPILELSMTL